MNKMILVIEDQAFMSEFLTFYLSDQYEVISKSNGAEAMDYLKEGVHPHLILADVNMPVMDGISFLLEVKGTEALKHIPVVMLSGKDNSEDRVYCLQKGAEDFVTKPFNPEELKLKIQLLFKRLYPEL
jgi:DNA-binding response OmpR family regulator